MSESPRTSRSSSRSAVMPVEDRARALHRVRPAHVLEALHQGRRTPRGTARAARRRARRARRSRTSGRWRTPATARRRSPRCRPATRRSARSSMVGSSAGGRLSTTNQPRSSSDLAAVDRPAPDMPVMMTMSGAVRGTGVTRFRHVADLRDGPGSSVRSALATVAASRGPMPGTAAISASDAAEIAFTEPNFFSSAARRAGPEPGHRVERARRWPPSPLGPVVGDREPVRLVPHPLQQVQPLGRAGHDHRVLLAGQPHLLEPLGEAADGHVVDAEVGERAGGRRDLARATVHDHQVRRVGELALSRSPAYVRREDLILIFPRPRDRRACRARRSPRAPPGSGGTGG